MKTPRCFTRSNPLRSHLRIAIAGGLFIAAGAIVGIGIFSQVQPARTSVAKSALAPNLEFAPLIVLAPDDNQTPTAGPFACVDPDGHPRSTVFHCYTTSDIYAAYGVGALHAEGTTGTDQPIVIVDAYGSPTVQQDLDRFSDTLVCRAHKSH